MARLSTADKWPSEIRELVGKLRAQGASIDAIRAKLAELDIDVARSTLGREIKDLDDVIKDIRQSREIAEAIGTRIEKGDTSSTARAAIEMLQSMTLKQMMAARGEGLEAKEAKALSEVLRNLATASKVDLDRELKIRDEIQRQLDAQKKVAADAAAEEGRQRGMDDEALAFLRAKILGIKLPAQGANG